MPPHQIITRKPNQIELVWPCINVFLFIQDSFLENDHIEMNSRIFSYDKLYITNGSVMMYKKTNLGYFVHYMWLIQKHWKQYIYNITLYIFVYIMPHRFLYHVKLGK